MDRISGLPEDLLLHILSFVTTRQAVQMSLLSKKWRNLWTFIPALHFYESEFCEYEEEGDSVSKRFLRFIDEVFNRQRENNNITEFHFSTCNPSKSIDANIVRKWILDAVRGGQVQELTIESAMWGGETIELPRCLFACRSLSVLKLELPTTQIDCENVFNFRLKLELPRTLCASRLKSLHLESLEFYELQRLITYCPFLEELDLRYFVCDDLKISAHRLEKLTIYDSCAGTIEISAPSLLSFNFHNFDVDDCILENSVLLVEADIKISYNDDHRRILEGISTVSSLTLTYSGIHFQQQDFRDDLPMFENLTYLELNICFDKHEIEVMIYILARSPNLKTLVITTYDEKLKNCHKEEDCYCWMEKQQSDQFLLHLRKIEIRNYHQPSAMQLEMQEELVKYLLVNHDNVFEQLVY